MKLTIFTATYNRGYIIENLYHSLQRQKTFDFEWLVIDDGSTDNTEQLFRVWLREDNHFPIRYYKQENQGLIRSLNRGIELAEGEYFAKIDSDDYLTDDYCISVTQWIEMLSEANDVYGVSGLRGSVCGIPLKGVTPTIPDNPGYIDATDLERPKYNLDADMSEAWRTEVLRKYPFPVWEGEKFAPEQIVFFQIALDGYKIRWFNKIICICEYQEDGLTRGSFDLIRKNPMGYAMMYNHMLKYPTKSFIEKCKAAMQMTALSIVGGNSGYILRSNRMDLSLLTLMLGVILSVRRKIQFSKEQK